MILSTFSFKNFKYFISNITYLYISSIILGGGLYLLNNQFSYNNNGLLFSSNKFELNIIFLLIASPVIIYFYLKQLKLLKTKYNNYYKYSFRQVHKFDPFITNFFSYNGLR